MGGRILTWPEGVILINATMLQHFHTHEVDVEWRVTKPIFSPSLQALQRWSRNTAPCYFVFNRNRGSNDSTLISCSSCKSSSGPGHLAGVTRSICLGSIVVCRIVWIILSNNYSFRLQPPPSPTPAATPCTMLYTFPHILFPLWKEALRPHQGISFGI